MEVALQRYILQHESTARIAYGRRENRGETERALVVTGLIELRDTNGNVLPTQERTVLCRCGASTKKPFCDGTHSKIGFQAAAQAVPDSAEKS